MRLRFGRLTSAEVSAALVRDHDRSESEARDAALLSDGSIGQALALADNDVTALRDAAMLLLRHTAERADTQSRVQAASALWSGPSKKERSREDLAVVLRLVASMLRDPEAMNAGADAAGLATAALA